MQHCQIWYTCLLHSGKVLMFLNFFFLAGKRKDHIESGSQAISYNQQEDKLLQDLTNHTEIKFPKNQKIIKQNKLFAFLK